MGVGGRVGTVDNSQCCAQGGDGNQAALWPGSCSDCFENPEVLINGQDGAGLWQWGQGAFSYEKQGRTLLAAVWQEACLPGLIARAQGRPWNHPGAKRSELRGHGTMSLPFFDLRDVDSSWKLQEMWGQQ